MKALVTGSAGLVGSEAVRFFLEKGYDVIGIDNNKRAEFFGPEGSILRNIVSHDRYKHLFIDIAQVNGIMGKYKFDIIIHAAAQPSHDWAVNDPFSDFGVNAMGTLEMLESYRELCPEAVFIYVSTNKVYGDSPNEIELMELPTRFEPAGQGFNPGINEGWSIDQTTHSLFGVSKLAGDLLTQEYGRYFGLKTGVFRCGCITGKQHAGVPLHGFLSYIAKCRKAGKVYTINGYKGKQVRDNIHAYDLINAFWHFAQDPKPGEVYNMGGGRHSNISVLEALQQMRVQFEYKDEPRKGDHIWYISDVSKFRKDYPKWDYTYDIGGILADLISA